MRRKGAGRGLIGGVACLAAWCTSAWPAADRREIDPRPALDRLLQEARFDEARRAAEDWLAGTNPPGSDPLVEAGVLESLARALHPANCAAAAKAPAERALRLREAAAGENDSSLAHALIPLAMVTSCEGAYADAVEQLGRAVRLRESAGLARDPLLVEALMWQGSLLARVARYDDARAVADRAVLIAETQLGPDHPLLAGALHRRASLAFRDHDLRTARDLVDRAIAIRRRVLRPDHFDTANSIGLLALIENDAGDYPAARRHYEESLDMLTRSYGAEHRILGSAQYNFALFLMQIGDLAGASPYMERSFQAIVSLVGPNHPDAVGSGAGRLAMEMGDFPAAREQLERSLRIRENYHGADADVTGFSAQALGELLLRLDEIGPAEQRLRQALAIAEKNHGPRSTAAANVLVPLGLLRERQSKWAEASALLERAYDIDREALGPDHPSTAVALGHLARLRFRAGQAGPALDASLAAIASLRGSLARTARALPERSALGYAATMQAMFDLPCTMLTGRGPRSTEAVERLWDSVVRSRGMVLDEMAARHRTVLDQESGAVRTLAETLSDARRELARYVFAAGPPGDGEGSSDRLRTLVEARDRAESALADRSAAFRDEKAVRDVGLAGVLEALPPGAALLSFVAYDDLAAGPSYLALIRGPRRTAPALLPLGKAPALEDKVLRWRDEASRPPRSPLDDARYREAAVALRRAIWDPVAAHLSGARLVLVVPDGALSLVNLATLPLDDGRYLLETDLRLHVLSAERDVIAAGSASPRGHGILLVGAPDFREAPSEAAVLLPGAAGAPGSPPPVYRGLRSSCASFRSRAFDPLPGSAAETEEIAALWRSATRSQEAGVANAAEREPVLRLVGGEASEEAFKRLSPRRRILHIATHGFFADGDCASRADQPSEDWLPPARRPRPSPTLENPLLLSGLAFAGANRRETGEDRGGEDGILTAEEIASLDLRGVEWALLSACGTGVGPSQNGEGVLGLRRTFRVAGARTVVMSLWDVGDQTTRDWMRRLYVSRLRSRPTVEAMRDAMLSIVQDRRAAGVTTHPSFWGAFVAAGDWR